MGDPWSIESFCFHHRQHAVVDHSVYPESTQEFLKDLGLSSLHPFCTDPSGHDAYLRDAGVTPMGSVEIDFMDLHDGSLWNALVTSWHMAIPSLMAMSSLWFILFAAVIAPFGCLYLMKCNGGEKINPRKLPKPSSTPSTTRISLVCIITVACSWIMMVDPMYAQDFGTGYGTTLFLLSSYIAFQACLRYQLRRTFISLLLFWIISFIFQFTTHAAAPKSLLVEEGLYHNEQNALVNRIVNLWDPARRTYSPATGATRWMTTGDARTGLPFFLNKLDNESDWKWTRVWMPTTSSDEEVLGLDISFPEAGYDPTKPVYLVFHGLSGGSAEGFVKDLAMRRNLQGSTVIVMVARGMMDTPSRSWNFFHGARTSDARDAALTVRRALSNPDQLLVGVGFSMGSIVLNNYVATYGEDCPLDAAFSISGALDCRYQLDQTRSKRLWQPMLQAGLKRRFLLRKHGERLLQRMKKSKFVQLLRASSVLDVDRLVAVAYHGYQSVEHFYGAMSALGDIPLADHAKNNTLAFAGKKIANVSIPLCILHALDDPISSWRTVAAPHGLLRPDMLVQSGQGNLMMLLTKAGGHVGWPLGWLSPMGWFSPRRNWEFMSEAVADYTEAVRKAKQERENQECAE